MTENNLNGFAISEELFTWLKNNLSPNKTILELGSGTGTIELTKFWKVFSIENNEEWLNVAPKSTYIHAPLKSYKKDLSSFKWFDISILKKEIPKNYDCLLIDAPTGQGRSGILFFMDLFPKWDIPIIIDDTHREEERRLATMLGAKLNRCVFDYNGNEKSYSIIE